MLRTVMPKTKLLSHQEQQVFVDNSWITIILHVLVLGIWET